MKPVKITVLKADVFADLEDKYAIPNLGPCPWHQTGQTFLWNGGPQPDNMCGFAWQALEPFARQLAAGELLQPTGTWLKDDATGVVACPDGIRPVIFLLEAQ